MAKYDERNFTSFANWYDVRAVLTVLFHTAAGGMVGDTIHRLHVALIERQPMPTTVVGLAAKAAQQMMQRIVIPPNHQQFYVPAFLFIGFGIGVGKALTYRKQAEELLCTAEMERHLRVLVKQSDVSERV